MRGDRLSDSEALAVELLAEGYRPGQIAARMEIGERTARTFIFRARKKLGATTAPQLAVLFDRQRRQK